MVKLVNHYRKFGILKGLHIMSKKGWVPNETQWTAVCIRMLIKWDIGGFRVMI